jgi:hypothetical protein
MSKLLDEVISEFRQREARGFSKYGTTMDREDLSLPEWIAHLREELMDALLYLWKVEEILNTKQNDTQRRTNYQEEDSRVNGSFNTDGEVDYPRASL